MSSGTRFHLRPYESPEAGRLALVTLDDGGGPRRPPSLGEDALASLEETLDELEHDKRWRGLLLLGKPFHFAAGADLHAFEGADADFARLASARGHAAFGRLRALPFPTVAALGGPCLGGGLEIALHCDGRVASTWARALGFPEVFLSIVPAWGGTQLAPRLVGARAALRVIVHNALDRNTTLTPREARDLGLVDRLVEPVELQEQSLRWLERLARGAEQIERPALQENGLDEALAEARQHAQARTGGATPAPERAIALVEFAARGGDLEEGLRREEAALQELLPSRQAQASVYAFQLTQERPRRQPGRPDEQARPVRRVGVLGAGTMGAQLAALFLRRLEVPVVLRDVDDDVLGRAREHVQQELDSAVQRGKLGEGKARFLAGILETSTEVEPLAGCDFVIEAVPEKLALKKQIFAEIEPRVAPGCVLATNTSGLSVEALGADLAHPERLVGFHFFNPVKALPLVEIVRAPATGDGAVATAFEVAGPLRKTPVVCRDAPAFVVNRILMRFLVACVEAAEAGRPFPDVDAAVRQLGLPMGPFALLGLVGVEIAADVLDTLHEAFPDRYPRVEGLQRLSEEGVPAVYDDQGRVRDDVRELWPVEAREDAPEDGEIRRRALEQAADEAKRLLDEGVVRDARDIDTGMILGAGWPFFLGGLCKHLDLAGISHKTFGEPLVGAEDRALARS